MKVLIVGLGGIGQRHVRNMRSMFGDDIEILAYRSRKMMRVITEQLDIEKDSNVEQKYNIQSYDNFEKAIAQDPSAVFVCNPSSLHIPVATIAAKAGCHLFIEKPLSHNFEGVEELIELVERKDLTCLVGYQMRFHPCLKFLREKLEEESVGRVLAVKSEVGEYLPRWHPYEDYRDMYASKRELGGGVILSQIHEFDYIYSLFGLPKRIFAIGGHFSNLEIDVEDTASILMENEVNGNLLPIHLHQDYVQQPPSRSVHIIGDKGKIIVDFHALSVIYYNQQGQLTESHHFKGFNRNNLFTEEIKHFFNCVAGKESPIVSICDGFNSLRMAVAAKESIETGNVIYL